MATVERIYEAFGRGHVDAILEQLDDDLEWEQGMRDTGLPYLQPGRGKDHVGAFFQRLGETLELTMFEPGSICDGGDVVVVPVHHAGRIVDGGDIPANHDAHEWRVGEIVRVTAG